MHRHVLVHVYLLNDGAALFCYLLARQRGIEKNVANHIECRVYITSADFCVISCTVFCGKSVVDTTHRIKLLADFPRTLALLCTFEEHMLKEMREPVLPLILIPRARARHHDHRGSSCLRHGDEHDPQAVFQSMDVVAHSEAHSIPSLEKRQNCCINATVLVLWHGH